MKANRIFIEGEEEAVSAVIGVILMVAITVAIAATVYVYVSGMIGGTATKTSTLSMNVYSRNDFTNETVWLVSGIEGEAVEDGTFQASLLFNNGTLDSGATIVKQEVVGAGYVNSGDTFKVTASQDGYFVFMITDMATGSTIYKSTSSKY
ncbi:MAG: type IV pilin N-terminal domain-containing protein [Thermoplasmatales archaeon]|nr:MAG: type IV pilin N-terminal domain-containing protein [Thermoplasmatales archaeon]